MMFFKNNTDDYTEEHHDYGCHKYMISFFVYRSDISLDKPVRYRHVHKEQDISEVVSEMRNK